MALINEDRLAGRINVWTGGRVTVAVGVALAVGLFIGAIFF